MNCASTSKAAPPSRAPAHVSASAARARRSSACWGWACLEVRAARLLRDELREHIQKVSGVAVAAYKATRQGLTRTPSASE
eukprot:15451961-Alexandrium_andersonii.AAC.1